MGNIFNVPRGPGKPPALYVADLCEGIVAATDHWTPDLVLVSAGFDAMAGDPLGGFTLEPEHYADAGPSDPGALSRTPGRPGCWREVTAPSGWRTGCWRTLKALE